MILRYTTLLGLLIVAGGITTSVWAADGVVLNAPPVAAVAPTPVTNNPATNNNPLAIGNGPLEVTAEQSLEYHQDKNMYVARGNAKIVRGDVTIMADELRAYEQTKPKGGKELSRFEAHGKVQIIAKAQHIYGSHALYDMNKKMAVVTGDGLRFVSDKVTVTAQDALEYWPDQQRAVARGKATAVKDNRRVTADRLIAYLRKDSKGAMALDRIEAENNVVITSPADVAQGDRALYLAQQNKAQLTGNVKITRGASHLNGAAAEVDFATGVSRLVATNDKTRVQALFVPEANQGKDALALPGSQ